jgi:outer membrane protein OmpA-like peptidoglycan-associated protein/tetratricopeptide (TPR) repeat protein
LYKNNSFYLHQMKNRLVFVFTFCTLHFAFFASAQYNVSKINKKAVDSYNKAMERIQNDDYKTAIAFFQEAIQKDGNYIDAYLSLAGVYGQMKKYQESTTYYEKAFAIDTNYTAFYRLSYSINLAGLGQFEKALSTVNALLARPDLDPRSRKSAEYRRSTYQFAVDFAKAHASENYVFAPQNLGDSVNTSESEYFPSLSIEGDKLIFTRLLDHRNEDFFGTIKQGNVWRKAVSLKGGINTSQNEGAQNVSQDGNWLLFTGCYRPDGYGGCDIYMSYLTANGWSQPFNVGGNINTDQWESQPSLSPDKRDLYFASRRFGGYGGADIYVSHLSPNGTWSKPENLGPEINTSADETEPFIHADNQTLYFVSNGLPGYGDADIFLTRRGNDGKWQKPENLGYPINTIDKDGTMIIASDGVTAYFSSDRSDSRGANDIYTFPMRPGMRPHKTLWIKGQVFDKKTAKGLPSAVELIDLATKQTISNVQTDETGNYLITLPVGKDYAFNVNRRGYLFYSDNYSLKDKSPDSTYQKNIPLQPIEVNASVVLKNIFFDVNKYDLKPESQVELDRVVQLMLDNPTLKIQIEGHTDDIGSAADNMKLSGNRAKAVVNYLVSKNISVTRLLAKGYGATQPIADNKTEEGRAQNRRTELKVVAR